MNQAAQATGTSIGLFSAQTKGAVGPAQALQNAVEPTIIQSFGEAIGVVNSKTGMMNTLVKGASGVVQDLSARMAVALSGPGLSVFTRNAVSDFRLLGDSFGNVFGAIGNILKVVPQYAQILLGLGDAFTKILETLTRVLSPVIGFGLALHGAIVYIGLAVTGIFALSSAITGTLIPALDRWAASLVTVAANPFTWVLVAAAAIAYLAYKTTQASDAAKSLIGNINTGLANMSASDAITAISTDVGKLNGQLGSVNDQVGVAIVKYADLGTSTKNALGASISGIPHSLASWHSLAQEGKNIGNAFTSGFKLITGGLSSISGAQHQASNDTKAYTGAISNLNREQSNLFGTIGKVMYGQTGATKQTYSFVQSLGILDVAGVHAGDSLDIMNEKVKGLLAGWAQMGVTGGQAGNAVNAISLATEIGQSQVSALTSAYSGFIDLVSGSANAFATFGLGMNTLTTNINTASGKTAVATDTLGRLRVQVPLVGATLA
jgi:hypothetical protein